MSFPKKTLADWEKLAQKDAGEVPLSSVTWNTPEGIAVKPLYTAEDLEKLEDTNTLPGFAPFIRGPRATMYAGRRPHINYMVGFQDHVLVVLYYQDSVTQVAQVFERVNEALIIALVQADARLIQDVHYVH